MSTVPAFAEVPPVKWTEVPLPGIGDAGGWVLAPGTDLYHLTVAIDGTLYTAVEPPAEGTRLFKSTDNGTAWVRLRTVDEVVTDIAIAPDDARLVYYTTTAAVYRSTDAGATFYTLPPLPVEADTECINALTVTGLDGKHTIAVSTRDGITGRHGHIYLFEENPLVSMWQRVEMGNGDILALAASPAFRLDHRLLAVTENETGTLLFTIRIDSSGYEIMSAPLVIPGLVPAAVSLAFTPVAGNTGELAAYLGVAAGNGGGICRIHWPLGMAGPVESLNLAAVPGGATSGINAIFAAGTAAAVELLAGAGGQVYRSEDGGISWEPALKQPTGEAVTGFAALPGTAADGYIFAATGGAQSALSWSIDGGRTWHQAGLIDTGIAAGGIVDLAVPPAYEQHQTLFLLTRDNGYSLWRGRGQNPDWERIYCTALTGECSFSLVAVSPQYGQEKQTVYLAGMMGEAPVVWRSGDGGNSFQVMNAPYAVDAWAIAGDDCLAIAGYDGTDSLICFSGNGGYYYTLPARVSTQTLRSIVLSPDYVHDRTLLAGTTAGLVYFSTDNGVSFQQMGQPLPGTTAAPGQVAVAFTPDFADSQTVYAASDYYTKEPNLARLYRFTIGRDRNWQAVDSTLPAKSIISQVVFSPDGVLYQTNSCAVNPGSGGGIRRTLDGASSTAFETVARGLENGATLHGLWLAGSRLWSVDTTNTRLMTFHDTLARPAVLQTPADAAPGIDINNVVLNWESLPGAAGYEWQVDMDDGFADIPDNFKGSGSASSAGLPALSLATTYYWRVRAAAPLTGPWSEVFSFHTRLGNAVVAPQLLSPAAGAVDQPVHPAFQWSGIDKAEGYELLVAPDISFTGPVLACEGVAAVSGTAYQAEAALAPGITYYWKVRAVGAGSYSAWSPVGVFTVASPVITPAPTPEIRAFLQSNAPASPTPNNIIINNTVTAPGFPAGLVILITAAAIVLTVLLIAIFVILIKRKP